MCRSTTLKTELNVSQYSRLFWQPNFSSWSINSIDSEHSIDSEQFLNWCYLFYLQSGKARGHPVEDLGPTPKLKHINPWDGSDSTGKCLVPLKLSVKLCEKKNWTCRPSAAKPLSGTPTRFFQVLFSRDFHRRAPTSSLLWLGDPGFAMPSWATQCRAFHN